MDTQTEFRPNQHFKTRVKQNTLNSRRIVLTGLYGTVQRI